MLHNRYFEVLRHYLVDYGRSIYGRELIGKCRLSQKAIALALLELEKKNILRSAKRGNMKYYSLNKDYSEVLDILSVAEHLKKVEFLAKERKLAHLFKHDARIVGIFGSYASERQSSYSDIDIFIVGKKIKYDYGEYGKMFDMEISTKFFSEMEFTKLLKNKNNLCSEIVRNHILVFGIDRFVEISWRHYYGFN